MPKRRTCAFGPRMSIAPSGDVRTLSSPHTECQAQVADPFDEHGAVGSHSHAAARPPGALTAIDSVGNSATVARTAALADLKVRGYIRPVWERTLRSLPAAAACQRRSTRPAS